MNKTKENNNIHLIERLNNSLFFFNTILMKFLKNQTKQGNNKDIAIKMAVVITMGSIFSRSFIPGAPPDFKFWIQEKELEFLIKEDKEYIKIIII